MKKYKLGIVGSGSLGSIIGKVVSSELSYNYEITGVLSRNIENARKLAEVINSKAYENIDEMLEDKPDYIIEAASPKVVKDIGIKVLEKGVNLIPLSVGAFADRKFLKEAKVAAMDNHCQIHIPSGAVGGFDVLMAANLMESISVKIVTQKSPKSLEGAPFLKGRKLSNENIEEVFVGTAKEAIEYFPKNINVAIATALATVGVSNTETIIRSVPDMVSNKHTIKLNGETIKANIEIASKPSKENPRSSTLAAWSVIAFLKNKVSPISF